MNKEKKEKIKNNILKNFTELIEKKPELLEDPEVKEAYDDLKKKLEKKQ